VLLLLLKYLDECLVDRLSSEWKREANLGAMAGATEIMLKLGETVKIGELAHILGGSLRGDVLSWGEEDDDCMAED